MRKPKSDFNLQNSYLKYIGESRVIEKIPGTELNGILENFFMCLKKADGSDYEPSSIRGILGTNHRYLDKKGYPANITIPSTFSGMQSILQSKYKVSFHV